MGLWCWGLPLSAFCCVIPRVLAHPHGPSGIVTTFQPVGRGEALAFPLHTGVGLCLHHFAHVLSARTWLCGHMKLTRAAGRWSLYSGWPCVQLKFGDSISKEKGKNGYWGQWHVDPLHHPVCHHLLAHPPRPSPSSPQVPSRTGPLLSYTQGLRTTSSLMPSPPVSLSPAPLCEHSKGQI